MRSSLPAALLGALVAIAPALSARAADEAPPPAAATAPTVTVAPVRLAQVQARVPITGTLVARQVVQVFPQVSGYEIVALNAEAGDRVQQGQELARLSDVTLTAQLAQAEAELQRAAAGVSQAQSQIASTEAAQKQAAAAVARC